jgi:hypothetical protein
MVSRETALSLENNNRKKMVPKECRISSCAQVRGAVNIFKK